MNFHTTHKTAFSLVLIALIVPVFLGAFPRPAEAQFEEIGSGLAGCALSALGGDVVGGLASFASNALRLSVPVNDQMLNAKESCLDAIVFAISKIVIRQMTDSIVRWINSGFQGEPLFLSDPERFFTDIAERGQQYVIWQVENSASIFAREVVVSLVKKKKKEYDLGDVAAQSCIDEVEEELAFNSSYEAGDYATRLARAEQKRKEIAPKGLFANVSSLARRALAQVTGSGDLPRASGERWIYGFTRSDGTTVTSEPFAGTREECEARMWQDPRHEGGGSCRLVEVEEAGDPVTALETGDYGYGRCPASDAEKDLVVRECLAGERSLSECGGGNFWYALTQNQENNALGAVLSAQNDVAARQGAARIRAENDLIAGRGFLSEKRCVEYAEPGDDTTPCVREITVTPGSYVAGAADQITASTFRSAELNREIGQAFDQIMGAFINQLITQGFSAISAQGGVFSRIGGQAFQAGTGELRNQFEVNRALERQLSDASRTAEEYVLIKKETIAATRDVVEKLEAVYRMGDGGLACPAVYEQARNDISKINDYGTVANSYENEVNVLATDIARLEELKTAAKNASGAGAGDIGTLYARIASRLPNSGNVGAAQGELQTIKGKQADATKWKSDCEKLISGQQLPQQGGGSI